MRALPLLPLLALTACTGGDAPDTTPDPGSGTDDGTLPGGVPEEYAFTGRDGRDSVATSGQVFRHLLIEDLVAHLGGLTARIDGGWFPTEGEVQAELDFYLAFDSATSGEVPIGYTSDPRPLQSVYDDLATDKDLLGKLAGNDPEGQHRDWSTDLVGWDDPAVTSPESLVASWTAALDAAAVARANGDIPLDPSGAPVAGVHLTADGHDLAELLEKFLRGAVAFSQGTDDYLDDADPGHGLLSDHAALEDGEPYTALEHAWDEGFGYFGAARTYPRWTDEEIADPGSRDVDGDGAVDLLAEVCWGHSTNAAKRDLGSQEAAATDLTRDAWTGFARGRQLLASTSGPLTAAQLDELRGHRNQAVHAWEAAIAATVVHYLNEVLVDQAAIGTPAYDFATHAQHWSELKGFALSFQFNPRSAVGDADFARLHDLLGDAPALDAATAGEYREDLLEAREILGAAFGFEYANLGGDDGTGGW